VNWKIKAAVGRTIARLPRPFSTAAYYLLQRRLGSLRRITPMSRLRLGAAMLRCLAERGRTARGATFLEVGTGWRLNVPLALWLCGAEGIISVDLNRYLKPRLVREDLDWLLRHRDCVWRLLGDYAEERTFHGRFEQLAAAAELAPDRLVAHLGFRYLAPADAARLPLPSRLVDFHVSCTVLEHVPPDTLKGILAEGSRLLKRNGLMLHFVDFSDHFAQSDPSLSSIHFLRFTDRQWQRFAGNRFMYHNRMRVSDYVRLGRELDLPVSIVDPQVDAGALAQLGDDFPLDPRFALNDPETNATANAWLIAPPCSRVNTAVAAPRRMAG